MGIVLKYSPLHQQEKHKQKGNMKSYLAGLLEDVPALTEILLRHVVPKNIVKLYKAEMSYDNAGGSKVMVDGYSVATSAASAKVTGKVTATDGIVYAIDSVI